MQTIKTPKSINFKPEVRTYVAPDIKESFIDDYGNIQHILSNGNLLSEINYIKHWGKPKGKINMDKKYKGAPIGNVQTRIN